MEINVLQNIESLQNFNMHFSVQISDKSIKIESNKSHLH